MKEEGLYKQSARGSIVNKKKFRVELKGKLGRKLKHNICSCYFKGLCRCFVVMLSNEMYLYIFCSILQLLYLVDFGLFTVLNSP